MKLFIVILCVSACYCGKIDITTYDESPSPPFDDDKTDGIIKPCSTSDIKCIRRFFAEHSHCTPSYGPTPDPYPIERLPMPIPNANLTFIWNNAQAKGLKDAVITEFYINKETHKLVLEIEVDSLSVFSPGSIARYHRKGREPIELTDFSFINYRMLSMTMVVPFDNAIHMDQADVYTYLGSPTPSSNIGQGLSNKDPEIQASYNRMMESFPTTMKEAFIVQGPMHMSVFIESTICNFECDTDSST